MSDDEAVAAHVQKFSHSYLVVYPEHSAREDDPHYIDFHHLQREWKKDPDKWRCAYGVEKGDFTECDLTHPLEIHHAHVEFALLNSIDLALFEKRYPGISDPDHLGAWVESAANCIVYCVRHHRGHAGVHSASAADWEASFVIRNLIQ